MKKEEEHVTSLLVTCGTSLYPLDHCLQLYLILFFFRSAQQGPPEVHDIYFGWRLTREVPLLTQNISACCEMGMVFFLEILRFGYLEH